MDVLEGVLDLHKHFLDLSEASPLLLLQRRRRLQILASAFHIVSVLLLHFQGLLAVAELLLFPLQPLSQVRDLEVLLP